LISLGLSTLSLACGMSGALAQTAPAQQQGPQVFEISCKPSPQPTPALRYRLLPPVYDQTPGNAASLYYTAALLVPKDNEEQKELLNRYGVMPIDQLPRDQVTAALVEYEGVLAQLDTAARREYCRWEPAFREQKFGALLAHLGPLRDAARALSLNARVQIAEGKWDEAARSLQTGYALATHVQSDGALVQVLVGAAIARMFDGVVRDWQTAPNSPNLYWAIAELPRPFANVAQSMQREQALLASMFPLLKDPDHATVEQWQDVLGQWNQIAPTIQGADDQRNPLQSAAITAMVLPAARAELLKSGIDKSKLDAMQPAQIAAIYCGRQFRSISDDMLKWMTQPYPLAIHGLKDVERRWDDATKTGTNPLMSLLPAVLRATSSSAMIDREIAMLQTVEAIRAFAAANNGALPRELDEMRETPAPLDPMTGEHFAYSVDGDHFTLEGIVVAGDQPRNGMRIEGSVK
jgi:hypothetical protein